MRILFLSFIAILFFTACVDEENSTAQTLAQVNGTNITATQFHSLLRQLPPNALDSNGRKNIASKLIDQELAVQKAIELKLDRQLKVLNQLEQAKREILAGAYAEYIANDIGPVSPNEISKYFNNHPELFTQRKIFHLDEFILPFNLRENEAFFKLVKKGGVSTEEIKIWLRENKIDFRLNGAIRPAESLPTQTLTKLNQAKIGDLVLFETPKTIILYLVTSTKKAPLTWEESKNSIAEYLHKIDAKKALLKDISFQRSKAEIRLFNEFKSLLE